MDGWGWFVEKFFFGFGFGGLSRYVVFFCCGGGDGWMDVL
jgi:hypothetical protein